MFLKMKKEHFLTHSMRSVVVPWYKSQTKTIHKKEATDEYPHECLELSLTKYYQIEIRNILNAFWILTKWDLLLESKDGLLYKNWLM